MPKVIALVGRSGSGKTKLISKILPLLTAKNIRVGTIKQTHHDVKLDTPGKDSSIHRESGSIRTAVITPDEFAIFGNKESAGIASFAEKYFSDMDLVILEGFKNENVYKMEVARNGLNKTPLFREMDFNIQVIITDKKEDYMRDSIENKIEILNLNNPDEVADFILKFLRSGT